MIQLVIGVIVGAFITINTFLAVTRKDVHERQEALLWMIFFVIVLERWYS